MKQHFIKLTGVCLVCLLIIFSLPLTASEAPQEILSAARSGLSEFVKVEALLGVTALRSSNGKVETPLGKGFEVFTINPQVLLKNKNMTLEPMAVSTGLWRFPVMNNGKATALLTMAQVDGKWAAVAVGGAVLAQQVYEVFTQWPEADGYQYRFIRIYQAKSDFIEISKNDTTVGFVPLGSARMAFGLQQDSFDADLLMHNSEILEPLREIVGNEFKKIGDAKAPEGENKEGR
ncbi:MAG: hypothetical protein GY765_21835 [bacterium]|nr:hypothetical protein [bacterium]